MFEGRVRTNHRGQTATGPSKKTAPRLKIHFFLVFLLCVYRAPYNRHLQRRRRIFPPDVFT